MSHEIITPTTTLLPLPAPQVPIATRIATMDDLPFIDALQKKHSKQLGFFPRAQMEGYIAQGWVIVAEESGSSKAIGYCASRDRYQKRDELGAIFQLCVDPSAQRKFVGAALLKSVFERASYGCRLFCCWCAQDLAANRFWEAMGFVPLAFRAGSVSKGKNGSPRVHIFWQKRIRQDDVVTPWWFPSGTGGGAIREDRVVLPIPPGVHWSEVKPVVVAGDEAEPGRVRLAAPSDVKTRSKEGAARDGAAKSGAASRTLQKTAAPTSAKRVPIGRAGGLRMAVAVPVVEKPAKAEKPKRERKPKAKTDPRMAAAARELRDRYLDEVNAGRHLIEPVGAKYDVGRMIDTTVVTQAKLIAA